MKDIPTQQTYKLRQRKKKSILQLFNLDDEFINLDDASYDEVISRRVRNGKTHQRGHGHRKNVYKDENEYDQNESEKQDIYDQKKILDKLPTSRKQLQSMLVYVNTQIERYRQIFINEQKQNKYKKSYIGQNSIPICADITHYNFQHLIKKQLQATNSYFDVIMMDPPWRLATSQPSRGVAIQYDNLPDQTIQRIPITKLQKNGFIFIWAINAKFAFAVKLIQKWGYQLVDSITWVKKTVNGRIAKGHGFYLQHAKQTCLIGFKGKLPQMHGSVVTDVIFSQRKGQSQKPSEIYEYIEQLVPNGYYLQIFGRRNNLRDRWITIGNEI